tara:strand:- start:122 stop:517 length:396 start_codon:yes stop_codon:yes gene_type:complete
MDTQHLTINEYSQQFKVSPNTIRRHINNKKLEAEKIDGKWLILVNQDVTQTNDIVTQKLLDEKDKHIEILNKQTHNLQQLLDDANEARTRSDTIIMQLTQQLERTQLQLEDLRETKTLWQRVRSVFIPKSA